VDEAALPDARDTDERHELGRLLAAHPRERVGEQRDLVAASEERRVHAARDVDAEPRPRRDGFLVGNRSGLALRDHRVSLPRYSIDCDVAR